MSRKATSESVWKVAENIVFQLLSMSISDREAALDQLKKTDKVMYAIVKNILSKHLG